MGEGGRVLSRRLSAAELYAALDSPADDAAAFLRRTVERRAPAALRRRGDRPLRALDVGCGNGRLLEPLARAGWEVVGMEPDPDFRAYAQTVASRLEGVEVRPGGFRDVTGEAEYDLVVGLNSSFSHVLDPHERRRSLERCHRALRPGGLVVLDVPDLLGILWDYAGPTELRCETEGGREVALHRTHSLDSDRAVFATHERYRVFDRDGAEVQTETREHPYAIVAWPELAFHLREAGFREPERRRSFRDPDIEETGSAPGGRIIAVAGRPA